MITNHDRKFKLGMHSYTLHLSGFGESWTALKLNYNKMSTTDQHRGLENGSIDIAIGLELPHWEEAGFQVKKLKKEETVAREVMEEAGIRVKNIRYYKSQPWGVVDDLLAGFYCEVNGDTEIHMDASELKLAEWKSRDEIELQPNDFSLTNEMMRGFKEGLV